METSTVCIRLMGVGDAERVAALCDQLGYPVEEKEVINRIEQILAAPNHALFAAEKQDLLIGWVHVHYLPMLVIDQHAELGGLVVDESHRNLGVGGLLMQQAEVWARSHGCKILYVRSNIVRAGAHEFYASLGYQKVKTQYTFQKSL